MQYAKLSDCAIIKFCSITPSRSKTQPTQTKWLVCANFLPENEVSIRPTINFVAPDEDWRLNQHDIVVKRIEPTYINYVDFAPEEVYCGNNLIIVTPKAFNDAKYLAMILNDRIDELSTESSVGAVMKSISRNNLESLEIPMPDENTRQLLGELWYKSLELKKKKIKLAELETERINQLINKSIHVSGGKNNG